ncbi:MAG: hypothetical protein K8I02_04295, partial [Candidatus Methylomirabilis sp.]|nr:hypothetical protein [Deltaproteobacteria bacterium]
TLGHGGVMAGLLEAMGMGEPTPSASVAFDVARLAELLPGSEAPAPRALVAPVAAADLPAALELSRALRAEGASVEMDVMERTIKQNLAYAVKRGVAYLVIVGEEERLKNRAAVRDLESKSQRDFALDDPAALARFLGGAS